MTNKKFTLLFASVLSLILLVGIVSATITFTSVPTLSQTQGSDKITVVSNTNEVINSITINSLTQNNKVISFASDATPINLLASTPRNLSINSIIPSDFEFYLGKTYSTTLTINSSVSGITTQTLNFESTPYCELGTNGTLEIRSLSIDNIEGFGDDEEWYPFDKIEVELEVKNTDTQNRVNDVTIAWGLYNSATGKWIIEDEEKSFDLKKEEKKTITFSFNVNPQDFDESSYEDFIFFVKAYSDDQGEDKQCISDSDSVKVLFDDDFVVLDSITFSAEKSQCGQEVQVNANVWNIGDDNQDDVYIIAYNQELGLNKKIEVGDINSLKRKKISFTFNVPSEIDEKSYPIKFTVYDEDDDIFENDDGDESVFTKNLVVEGNCILTPKVSVSAVLESGGKSGKELIIKSTITNTDSKTMTYTLGASGYTSWASLTSIDPVTITLNAGERKDVTYKLNVNSNVEGTQTFDIEVKTGNTERETLRQSVQVTVEKSSILPGISGFAVSNDNWYLWGIGALNVILIIVIIVVAIRVARS